jgi:membrane protein implicated in regulation of membrane protease activity
MESIAAKGTSQDWLATAAPVALACLQTLTPTAAAAVSGGQPLDALRRLLQLALTPGTPPMASSMAAVCVAAFLNKWESAGSSEAVEVAVTELRGATATALSAMDTGGGSAEEAVRLPPLCLLLLPSFQRNVVPRGVLPNDCISTLMYALH